MILLRGANFGHHTGDCSRIQLVIGSWLMIIMRARILGSLPVTATPVFQEGQRKESPWDTTCVIPTISEAKSRCFAILPVESCMIEAIRQQRPELLVWEIEGQNSDIRRKISCKASSSSAIDVFIRQSMAARSGCKRAISSLSDEKSKSFIVRLQTCHANRMASPWESVKMRSASSLEDDNGFSIRSWQFRNQWNRCFSMLIDQRQNTYAMTHIAKLFNGSKTPQLVFVAIF
jgi:hypothetical protein